MHVIRASLFSSVFFGKGGTIIGLQYCYDS